MYREALEGGVDFVVEAVNFAGAGEGDEFDFFSVAGFESYGSAGCDVKAEASGGFTVEVEGFVDFVEMKMAADLNRTVAGVADS